jgi:hypothetical protein
MLREGASQIDGGGRLADATLLVCDRDDVGHRGFTSLGVCRRLCDY